MKRLYNKPVALLTRRDDSPYDEKCRLGTATNLGHLFILVRKFREKARSVNSTHLLLVSFFRPKGIRHLDFLPSSKTSSVLDSEDVQVGEASVVKALIKH